MGQHQSQVICEETKMAKGPSRQRYIRLDGDLDRKVAALAEAEDLPISMVIKRLLRQALAQKAHTQHSAAA